MMKQLSTLLLVLCLFVSPRLTAQVQDTTITVPNGNFEQWSNGSGYSVTVVIVPLSIYGSYTYPTGWNYLSYPVNETFAYNGINFNVNTDIPLLKVSNETSSVYEGSHALKMQSFMLSDILSSVIYNLFQASLDPTITSMVFPTVLSTAEVNLDTFLPLMLDLADNFDDISNLMSVLDTLNLSNLVEGGIDLNGLVPSRLTGHYKYTSADSGDNGGVLLVGTKYNPETHQRRVVGAGFTVDLTDTAEYTPFEVVYTSLADIVPSASYVIPDSMIIFLFSSANTNPQQGSALYLDNLQLWGHEPDTCSAAFNLHLIDVDTTHATLGWGFEGDPYYFEAEYGVQGFAQGSGTLVETGESFLHLSNLQPDTYYDIYVHCVCAHELAGDWAMTTFHTDTLPVHTGVQTLTADKLQVYPNPAHGQCTVRFEQEIPAVVRLFSADGTLLKEIVPTKETLELTLPSQGVFILSCETKEGTVMRKIVNQ